MPSETMGSLYDRDALAWSEHQADLLRRLAAGERVNASVDWANVIEEIEAVGRSDLWRCEGQLRQALIHLLKMHAWPGSQALGHWRGETVGFLYGAHRSFSPSMRQKIDLRHIFRSALRQVRMSEDDVSILSGIPDECPFMLDELVAEAPDIAALAARLAPMKPSAPIGH